MMRAKNLWLPALVACLLPAAQDPAPQGTLPVAAEHSLVLMLGRGRLLRFPGDITRVAVAEPKIADAVVVSPREVMVNAKAAGHTTLLIWPANSEPIQYNVQVLPDTTFLEDLRRQLKEALPEAQIKADGTAEKMVLTGSARSEDEAKRAAALAATYARTVENLIKVPSPPEPRQILLQVKFASVDRVALSELGFNYFSRNDKTLGSVTTQQFTYPRFSQFQFQDQQFANATLSFSDLLNLFIFRPDLNIGATIRALQARNLLQILAEPNLIAVEGKEASFLAGGQFPFPTITTTPTGGAIAPVISVQFKDFGVQLKFTPSLTESGAIRLRVTPEVSSLDFTNAVQLQGFLIPAIATRRAETEVILKDGETFAIAGLLDNRVEQVLSKIPGIGDIPIIGHLFRSRSTRKTANELLVVITPRFVRPLSPEEKAVLPETIEPFLPPTAEDKARQGKKREARQPEFVGPRGHQEPK